MLLIFVYISPSIILAKVCKFSSGKSLNVVSIRRRGVFFSFPFISPSSLQEFEITSSKNLFFILAVPNESPAGIIEWGGSVCMVTNHKSEKQTNKEDDLIAVNTDIDTKEQGRANVRYD